MSCSLQRAPFCSYDPPRRAVSWQISNICQTGSLRHEKPNQMGYLVVIAHHRFPHCAPPHFWPVSCFCRGRRAASLLLLFDLRAASWRAADGDSREPPARSGPIIAVDVKKPGLWK